MNIRRIILGAIAAPIFLAGCGDSNPFAAQLPTVQDAFTIFALTGTPPAYPSGLDTYGQSPARVDGNAAFDVAFDINADGNAVLYPVKLIVSSITGDRTVGLKKVAAAFDSVTSAPTGTYQGDSAVVAAKGDVIVVETNRSATGDVCSLNISPNIYAKILIDSINPGAHTIAIQMVLDPNCGYRSFLAGIPGK